MRDTVDDVDARDQRGIEETRDAVVESETPLLHKAKHDGRRERLRDAGGAKRVFGTQGTRPPPSESPARAAPIQVAGWIDDLNDDPRNAALDLARDRRLQPPHQRWMRRANRARRQSQRRGGNHRGDAATAELHLAPPRAASPPRSQRPSDTPTPSG